jgi:plastocyanin
VTVAKPNIQPRFLAALVALGLITTLPAPVFAAQPCCAIVAIADSGLTPPEVTVTAGGSVAWTNRGKGQHEITATGDAFPRFSLAPGGTRSVPFMQPGQYPYLLDGAAKGKVIVVAGLGGAGRTGDSGQSSASPPGCILTIYRYDVRVAVHREAANAGTAGQKTAIDWKASWVAPMSVVRCFGDVTINIPAVNDVMHAGTGRSDRLNGGQFEATVDLNEPDCHYTYVTTKLSAFMWFRVGNLAIGQTHLDILAGQDFEDKATSSADFNREDEVRVAACGPHKNWRSRRYTTIGSAGMPLNPFNGMIIGDDQLHLTFAVPPNSPVDTPILDALAAGKGLNYDTGMQMYEDKGGTSSRVRAIVSFSRLEN